MMKIKPFIILPISLELYVNTELFRDNSGKFLYIHRIQATLTGNNNNNDDNPRSIEAALTAEQIAPRRAVNSDQKAQL